MRLGEFVSGILEEWRGQLCSPLTRIRDLWPEIAGQTVAAHATPVSLRRSVLIVSVDSAVWAAELSRFHSGELLAGVRKHFGDEVVTQLRFTVRSEPARRNLSTGGSTNS